ncbi:BamA/TamA family outer membrane protein [Hymenobacter caeli]|uniref:Outer membrane protein assembly factor BamA n=1 Tax=Hymenobacter caeli TaxID=2735894 RepID=A0ABX2FU73_9BACT|nr:BamA/TamA family outer membrane protein [Hymenobacter caeli]NRT20561.1 outer membrane protein assembly factor BamA [Hymenobacter caeli]
MRFLSFAALLAGLSSAALAQPAASPDGPVVPLAVKPAPPAPALGKPKKNLTILPIPVLFYQAETGIGYGIGGLLSGRFGADTTVRSSNARIQYWQTAKKQSLIQFVHTIYTPGEKYYLNGEVSGYDQLLYYYGKGNNTATGNQSNVAYKLFIVNQRVQKAIAPKLFFGAQYRLTDVSQIEARDGSEDGGTNYFYRDPRLSDRERMGTTVSGLGPVLTYDTRDVALGATHGNLVDATVMFNGKALGSDYKFVRYQLDVRHYQPVFSDNTIFAVQFLGQFHSGDVPFRELAGIGANLGGTLYDNANLLRGIYEQRYRDRQMMMVQAELRQHVFWRIDVAAFAGAGEVANGASDFSTSGIKGSGGAGLRFNFIRRDRVNLRLDYAAGAGSKSGILFAIGEAF